MTTITAGSEDVVLPRPVMVGTLMAGVGGLVGSLFTNGAVFGLVELRVRWLDFVPWLMVVALGAWSASGGSRRRSGPLAGAIAVAATFAGPALVQSVLFLQLWRDGDYMLRDRKEDALTPFASALGITGSVLTILCTLVLLLAVVTLAARVATIPRSLVPRSPYRIEILTSVGLLVLGCAVLTVADVASSPFDVSRAWVIAWLTWLLPTVIVLAFGLRRSGRMSLWIAVTVAISLALLPLLPRVAEPVNEALGWGTIDSSPGTGFTLLAASGALDVSAEVWAALVTVLIAALTLLWNSTPQAPAVGDAPPPDAPLEPWAGVALVLSFIPVLSIPALILGHVAYDRVIRTGQGHRGRLVAAGAMVLALVNVGVVLLFLTGSLAAAADILIGT